MNFAMRIPRNNFGLAEESPSAIEDAVKSKRKIHHAAAHGSPREEVCADGITANAKAEYRTADVPDGIYDFFNGGESLILRPVAS